MRRTKSQSSEETGVAGLGPGRDISAANYVERARAHIAVAGGGVGFVIRGIDGQKGALVTRQTETESQWVAWIGYFAWKGIPYKFLLEHGQGTVPTEWPEQFDGEIPESGPALAALDRYGKIPVIPKENRDAMRIRVSALFATLQRRVADWGTPKRKQGPAYTAEEALREYGAQPLSVSPEFKAAVAAPAPREPMFD